MPFGFVMFVSVHESASIRTSLDLKIHLYYLIKSLGFYFMSLNAF